MFRKLIPFVLMLAAGLCFTTATAQAQKTGKITGHVTDQSTGKALIGANVYISTLQTGAATNSSGKFTIKDIPYGTYKLRVSYIGYSTKTIKIKVDDPTETVNIALQPSVKNLNQLVVTALGIKSEKRSVTFSSATVKAKDLTIAPNSNVKQALVGKVAGVQLLAEAGSRLGDYGNIRIRGGLSLTSSENDPLFVVNGVPIEDPAMVDMSNVSSVSVLKGPAATALYGQRGTDGVVVISTQEATKNGVSIEFHSSYQWQQVANLPDFQNKYGQGYAGQEEWYKYNYVPGVSPPYFKPLDGKRFIVASNGDASWGPRLDGEPYAAWFTWWPDSPYYGQSVPFKAHPNTVANFYNTGLVAKNGIAINVYNNGFRGRVTFTNLRHKGILPYTNLKKRYMTGNFSFDVNQNFQISANVAYTLQEIHGQVYAGGYGNQTSGTFNNWYGRNLSTKYMRQLAGLKTPEGYYTSWNWWNPIRYTEAFNGKRSEAYLKPAFWFNPYTWMKQYQVPQKSTHLILSFNATYDLTDNLTLKASISHRKSISNSQFYMPYSMQKTSGHKLYQHYVNSFGVTGSQDVENLYKARLNYSGNAGDFTFDAYAGATFRNDFGRYHSAQMDFNNDGSGGLIIPNVYLFSNSKEAIIPSVTAYQKQVFSMYGKLKVGYQDFLYVNGTYRQDYSSALFEYHNGYGYPSVGVSFVFSHFIHPDFLSWGKIRATWGQVGSDVGAEVLIPSYDIASNPYSSPITGQTIPLLYVDNQLIDPNITPSINSEWEVGFDMRFFKSRAGVTFTYYHGTKKDEIISVGLSTTTGYNSYITNGGSRVYHGVELKLDGNIIQSNNFIWHATLTYANNYSKVISLPGGKQTLDIANSGFGFIYVTQKVGMQYGQLRGAGIARNDEGLPIITVDQQGNPTGFYKTDPVKYYGSMMPDWNGGFINSFTYKNFNLSFAIDFQKGGKFYSLTEFWGSYTGLMAWTAGLNDLGNPKRGFIYKQKKINPKGPQMVKYIPIKRNGHKVLLPKDKRGGTHVVGVTPKGKPVDMYVNTHDYYQQFYGGRIAEPYVHDASYVKLRSISLSYELPNNVLGNVVSSATLSVVARNVLMLYTNNPNHWDPSQFSNTYGENAQMGGTRNIGFSIDITF